ncbi:MAG: saccharopine dehydrogenase NADP-binding domain-containing protein [Hormoscilla sp. GM102CHS1]|nr:saccharopine dehydrogenase NADP-binding domain-containing protein [Hormoscilla sp. GM102CHS1]
MNRILILGGTGRIGRSVTQDLLTHCQDVEITVTGRHPATISPRAKFLSLDLADISGLRQAVASANCVIHCAGPFHHRDARVLQIAIETGVNYLDVSDHRSFTQKALAYADAAVKAGVTAIVNTGVFPGISNSMARQCVEQLDEPESIKINYVVSGSGGAGLTVMRTTFLGLQAPFQAWLDGKWQAVKPYSDRTPVKFPPPFNRVGVYWYDMPETSSLARAFPVKTVITKFGSHPDFYNYLTWTVAHWFPQKLLQNRNFIERLSAISYRMTQVTDRFSGIGVAMQVECTGKKACQLAHAAATLIHEDTAAAAGCGTGSIAELILANRLHKPGVWTTEQALPTDLFAETMRSRAIYISQTFSSKVGGAHPT